MDFGYAINSMVVYLSKVLLMVNIIFTIVYITLCHHCSYIHFSHIHFSYIHRDPTHYIPICRNPSVSVASITSYHHQRPSQNLTFGPEYHVTSGCHFPLYQIGSQTIQFDSCDAIRMNTAAGVQINTILRLIHRFRQSGSVCMASHKNDTIFLGPLLQLALCSISSFMILGSTRRIIHAKLLQWSPEIPHQKSCQTTHDTVFEFHLMSMCQPDFHTAVSCLQYHSLRQNPLHYVVMIAKKTCYPAFSLQNVKQSIRLTMAADNLIPTPVFPEFLAITQLNIIITPLHIVL